MNNPEVPFKLELSVREQALAIINAWKAEGFEKVSVLTSDMSVVPGIVEGGLPYDIDNSKVIMWLTQSLEKGKEYNINKE